jgi:hypothetical protein
LNQGNDTLEATMLRLGRRSFLRILGALGLLAIPSASPAIRVASRWIIRAEDV